MMKDLYENTILIVDDSPVNISVLAALLEDFDMKTAISGEAALEAVFNETPPDLVLLDIMMPNMDGYEVCRRLRADERGKEVPIIFLTAKVQTEDILKGFEIGGQDYITKPFNARELIERVKVQLKLKMQREFLKSMSELMEEKVAERTKELIMSRQKLDLANKKLKVLDEAKNQFLKLISHEIRTPLNGILGPVYFLNDLIDNPEAKEMLEVVLDSVERLQRVSKLALDITQMQTAGHEMPRKVIDIRSVIDKVTSAALSAARQRNLSFSTSLNTTGSLFAVELYFTRCLEELIDNAIRFSHENEVIYIETFTDSERYILKVREKGEVIPANKIDEIVQPFGKGLEPHDEHIGLGLHYVQTFLNIHEASMEIESCAEKTEISLYFRLEK
ncbi:MAG: response regulator [Bacteroidales bacterium]|jgi:two-component system sensor histidine kinase/response regulator|nr:response regulator [Bacteroidales bacterium]